MKYLTVPAPMDMVVDQGKSIKYQFNEFLSEQVWTHAVWRQSKDSYDRFVECVTAFKDCKEGDVIELSDKAYEMFSPVASLRDQQLAPRNLQEIMQFVGAVLKATSEKPE